MKPSKFPLNQIRQNPMTRHAPTPWIIYDQFIASKKAIDAGDWDNAWVCQWQSYTTLANAKMIVKSVNEYAKKRKQP